ncbi:MAG: serine/threonine protein kinase [Ramlibacter sp.]|nr:serine/threonine protein kinase [Ramlibacter sp.]
MDTTIEVVEQSQVGQVRRLVAEIGHSQQLSAADLGRAALVATEVSTNLVKYGKSGSVTVSPFFDEGAVGIQLIAVDQGPGFADFEAAARDGHSTGGTLGIGLGAIIRASDLFDSYTAPQQGSAFLARVARGRIAPRETAARIVVGGRRTSMRGETECGDAWAHASCGRWERICVVDGLGHGPLAAVASAAALDVFLAAVEADSPETIIRNCHAAMNGTRGAVMGVAAIDVEAGRFIFTGVGNITGMVHSGFEAKHLMSTEGIVGHNLRSIRNVERTWSPGDAVVLSSDGLSGRWNVARYDGLQQHHPLLVASVLFRDFARDTDDATVVVAKDRR